VFTAPDGRFAELFRWVPDRSPSRRAAALEVAATLHAAEHVQREMIRFEELVFDTGYAGSPTNPFPEGAVLVAGFEIDAYEVTIAEFERFLEATGQARPEAWGETVTSELGDRPATGISWELAQRYAEWAGKRLPTLFEFDRAARGVEGRLHPWPDVEAPPESVRVWAAVDRLGERSMSASMRDAALFAELVGPVGSHPRDRSDDGVFDLLGSVSEWVETPWILVGSDATRTFAPRMRILKGSNWAMQLTHLGWCLWTARTPS
jgi:formylglycine-generating enzyme required for sulfatase activity